MMTLKPTLNIFISEIFLRLAILSLISYITIAVETHLEEHSLTPKILFLLSFSENSLRFPGKKNKRRQTKPKTPQYDHRQQQLPQANSFKCKQHALLLCLQDNTA